MMANKLNDSVLCTSHRQKKRKIANETQSQPSFFALLPLQGDADAGDNDGCGEGEDEAEDGPSYPSLTGTEMSTARGRNSNTRYAHRIHDV